MEKSKNKKKKNSSLIYAAIAALVVFGAIFAYNIYDHYLYWQDGRAAQENTDAIVDIFRGQMEGINQLIVALPPVVDTKAEDAGPGTQTAADGAGDVQPIGIHFDASPLEAARELTQNPDIVAYLFIEGTNVNNVVVQGVDNNFYLHRDMFGNRNINGSLFMDFRNSPDFTDRNTIIYGHNMQNGTMFHNLRYYMRRDFFEAHPHIKVITDDTIFIYEIFAIFSTHIYFDYIQVDFEDDEEFGALLREMTRRSVFNTGVTANQYDRIIVLSTCTNVDRNTRIVVVGRLAIELMIYSE